MAILLKTVSLFFYDLVSSVVNFLVRIPVEHATLPSG